MRIIRRTDIDCVNVIACNEIANLFLSIRTAIGQQTLEPFLGYAHKLL